MKKQLDLILNSKDITAFLWPLKKTGYSAIDGTKGNLTQDWLPGDRKPSQSFYTKRYHKRLKNSRKIKEVIKKTEYCW